MKLLGRINPNVEEILAGEVKKGDRLAAGRFQAFSLSNADSAGETVIEVTKLDGLVYIRGDREPGWEWTLAPEETVMIEVEK